MPAAPRVDRASFEDVVATHRDRVLGICLSILRDHDLGADATQETFLRLWRDLCRDRAPDQVAGWLRKVAVHTSIDLLRRRQAREAALPFGADATDAVGGSDPAEDVTFAELSARYEQALGTLSERQRVTFLLRHEGGMTLAQVAAALGVSLPTTKTQFARACRKLQATLSAFRPGGSP